MDLRSYKGEKGSFLAVSKQTDVEQVSVELQTDQIECFSQGAGRPPTKNKKVQSDVAAKLKLADVDLSGFLRSAVPTMLEQLGKATKAFHCISQVDYEVEWGADNDLNTVIKHLPEDQASVSCVSWNNRGTVLAIGYSHASHLGWCAHKSVLKIWHAFKDQKPTEFEVQGCISALAFHPSSPLALVAGTFNGQLLLFDLEKQDALTGQSSIDEYQHRQAVTELMFANEYGGPPRLYSVSTDGKVLQWRSQRLQHPLRGFLLTSKSGLQGGLSLSNPAGDPDNLMVGTEGGRVLRLGLPELNTQSLALNGPKWKEDAELVLSNLDLRYRPQAQQAAERYADILRLKEVTVEALFNCKLDLMRMYPSPVNFVYEGHDGPVAGVVCNPFNRSLFATCSSDGTARLYHYLEAKPLLELEPIVGKRLTCLAWSLTRPLVLAVGCENGTVYIYDFLQDQGAPVTAFGRPKSSVGKLAFNGSVKDLLAVGYAVGGVEVVQLAPTFSTPHPDEQRRLQALFRQVTE